MYFQRFPKEKKFSNYIGISTGELNQEGIEDLISEFETQADYNYKIEPYWSDFRFLLEAVEIEKKINIDGSASNCRWSQFLM